MKIAIAQLNYHIGNFYQNSERIITHIERAKAEDAELVVFSELSVCGYYPHDLLERKEFIENTQRAINKIVKACSGIAAIVGAPTINESQRGKKLFNSALFIENQTVQKIIHKTLLPTYDIFDEYRHFEPNKVFETIDFNGHTLALTICEDLWDNQPTNNSFAKSKMYITSPLEELCKQNPDLIINIAASPFSFDQEGNRKATLQRNAAEYQLPLVYVNQVGAQTEIIFDGGSMFISPKGEIVQEMSYFEEDFRIIDTDNTSTKSLQTREPAIAKINRALELGVKDYFEKMGFKSATLGLSGGIDSAVVAVLAVRALGSENVRVLLMPSKYSSDHSITDAVKLAKNLGIEYQTIPIQPIVDSFEKALNPIFDGLPADVTEENIQARTRGVLVMALSNKFGNILLNTSNKSECAVGYGTLYGDMNGGLSVLGDVYKTDVFELARYMNRNEEVIPENIISKPPSAELRPDQKDSDSLPDYAILDEILYRYIEQNQSPDEIIAAGYDAETVKRTARMVNMNEYKRFQTAPVLRISSKAFGFGRKMPLVAKYNL
ncbi:MAG: NAD+ synthase [Prolixibacteraceae bacterium]|nr:NAD+ synthase [Prolixibacteraceae bacterium]MBN2648613.1 NAD+ synthase [Prolixibacteraceae bacterium]